MELLARQNTAQKSCLNYLEEISKLLGIEVKAEDVLDLSATGQLHANWLSTWDEQADGNLMLRKRWPFEEKESWIERCRCVAEHLGARPAALMIGAYGYCGAIRMPAKRTLREPWALLEHDKGEIRVKSLEDDSGICVDWFEELGTQLIELVVWGDWCELVRPCFN